MNSLQHIWTKLQGKKTYLVALAGGFYAWGIQQNVWQHDQLFDWLLAGGLAASLRHGWQTEAAKIVQAALTAPPILPPMTPAVPPPPAPKAGGFAEWRTALALFALSCLAL